MLGDLPLTAAVLPPLARAPDLPNPVLAALPTQVPPYHKTTSYTRACKALPWTNFSFRMGCWATADGSSRLIGTKPRNQALARYRPDRALRERSGTTCAPTRRCMDGGRQPSISAKVLDEGAHRPRLPGVFRPPHPLEQLLVSQHPPGVDRKLGEQPVLDVGERDGAAPVAPPTACPFSGVADGPG